MTTWTDLHRSIRATGAINPRLALSIAVMTAKREHKEWAAMGMTRPISQCLAEAKALVWSRAQDMLDEEIAQRVRAAMPAAEQFARTADMEAILCDHAIPPRHAKATEWRKLAADLRRTQFHLIAAE